jgi:peptidoglycan/LPS O-acetylase OafA/YrhL
MDDHRPGLDDPHYASFAWDRFRRILGWMTLVAAVVAAASVAILWISIGEMYWAMAIGTAAGVFFTIELTAALMGLMFLSSGTGHDEQVEDLLKGEADLD